MSYSILDAIGNTPLVEIKHLNPNPKVRILAKLEYMNPGGSVKDRAALYLIEAGEKSGELTHEKIVIEATSGNTGIGLAMVCSVKGYRLLLAMSDAVSIERRKILKARGADILLTPGHLGTDGAIEEVYRLARENPDKYYMADQYNSEANWKAHYNGTAVEVWDQTDGAVTTLVATIGTTGTLMGMSRRLKDYNPDIRIVGVEPYLGHKIQGLKNMKEAYCPEIYNKKLLDVKVNIDDEDAFEMARNLARVEGLFVGMSSGAAMAIAVKEAEKMEEGTIVVMCPDSGERYLSTTLFAEQEKIEMRVFNTMSHSKEPFDPIHPGKASVYSCGPTAYAPIHLGEARRFIFSDILCRYLEFRGYDVNHIMNITDLDDKTIIDSEKAGKPIEAFTGEHIASFKRDLKSLGIKPAAKYPLASEHVEDMVQLADKLTQKGYAYEKLRSLYFNISRFPEYGRLSGIDLDKIKLGATVDLDEYEKENPRDFTLLKRSKLSELKRGIYAKTAWGNVRPSWHIQCPAISMKHLGERFDIHTSSRELVFPHHENVHAIASAVTGKPLVKYWMHCDNVMVEGKQIGDKGDRITLKDLTDKGYTPRDIRYWLLATHYRKPVIYSESSLANTSQALKRLDTFIASLKNHKSGSEYQDLDQLLYDIRNGFIRAMDDDLNMSAALASLFKIVKKVNILMFEGGIDKDGALKVAGIFNDIDSVLNIFSMKKNIADNNVENLLEKREQARREKKFELADLLRNQLLDMGVEVKDEKI
ncbi:MAG: cysteine--tRNA ligase [Desulfobacterales bacterium]|nr:cysteine--tRNA ligase [Desulfobacterales bacterium]